MRDVKYRRARWSLVQTIDRPLVWSSKLEAQGRTCIAKSAKKCEGGWFGVMHSGFRTNSPIVKYGLITHINVTSQIFAAITLLELLESWIRKEDNREQFLVVLTPQSILSDCYS